MAVSTRTWVAGELVTAALGNAQWRDNIDGLYAGNMAISGQAANDIIYASTATQLARLAAGTSGYLLKSQGAGSPPAYVNANPIGTHEFTIPILAMRPQPNAPYGAFEDVACGAGAYVGAAPFDKDTQEAGYFIYALPKSCSQASVTFQPYWFNTAGGAGNVVWSIGAIAFSSGDSLATNISTATSVTVAAVAANTLSVGSESAAHTVEGTPATSDLIRIVMFRSATDGSDTYANDAYLALYKLRLSFTTGNDN